MDFDDITKKAESFLGDNKVKDALKSSEAEDISDKLLDGVAGEVNKLTGDKFKGAVDGARDAADGAVGDK